MKLFIKWPLLIGTIVSCYGTIDFSTLAPFKFRGSHPISINEHFVVKRSRGSKIDNQEIIREGQILRYLNAVGCRSCPELIEMDTDESGRAYLVIERIPKASRPTKEMIYEAYLEQKNLGVFQNDPNISNLRRRGDQCIIIDYGLAIINHNYIHMGNDAFFSLFFDKINP